MEKELQLTITLYGTVTEKQREAVKNELERICGLRKGQYQILASEDGMEGVGSFPSSGESLLLVAGLPVTRKNSKTAEDQNAEKTRLESRLEELLSNVEGVGEVKVMLSVQEKTAEFYGDEEAPQVEGVVIVAEGVGNSVVERNIQQAVMALFQVDAHRIRIMKMK